MLMLSILGAALPHVYAGSNHLGQAIGSPSIRNTTIFLTTRAHPKNGQDTMLVLQHVSGKWMSSGGQIDAIHGVAGDRTFEEAVVREFLEETGLATFPSVTNADYCDYGSKGRPHTRVFRAQTADKLTGFSYQPNEVQNHAFDTIIDLRKAKGSRYRNSKTFNQLLKNPLPRWAKFHPSGTGGASEPLSNFAGAYLATDGKKTNIVVKRGQQPPKGFHKGAYWWKSSGAANPSQTSNKSKSQSSGESKGWLAAAAAAIGLGACTWWKSDKPVEDPPATIPAPSHPGQDQLAQPPEVKGPAENSDENRQTEGSSSGLIILFVIIALAAVIGAVVWFMHRKPENEPILQPLQDEEPIDVVVDEKPEKQDL